MAANSETHGPQGLANKTYIQWIPVAIVNQEAVSAPVNGDNRNHGSIWRPFESGNIGQNLDAYQKPETIEKENFKAKDGGREQGLLDQTTDTPWNRSQPIDQPPRIMSYWSEAPEIPIPPPPSPQMIDNKGPRRSDSNSRNMIFQPNQEDLAVIPLPIDNQSGVLNQGWKFGMMTENHNDGLLPCNKLSFRPNEANIPPRAMTQMSLNIPTSTNYQLGTRERKDLREKLTWSRQSNASENNWNQNNKKKQKRRQFLRQKKAKYPQNKWKRNKQPLTQNEMPNHFLEDPNRSLNEFRNYTTKNKQNYQFELLAPSINMLKKPTLNPFAEPHYEDDMLTGQRNPPHSPLTQKLVEQMEALQIDPKETQKKPSYAAQTNSQMTGLPPHNPQGTQNPTKDPTEPNHQGKKVQTNANNSPDEENTKAQTRNNNPMQGAEPYNASLNEQSEMITQTNQNKPNESHQAQIPKTPNDKPLVTIHPQEVRKHFTTAYKETPGKIDMLINRYQIHFENANSMTMLAKIHRDKPFFPQIQEAIIENQKSMTEVLDEIKDLSKKALKLEEDDYITAPRFGEEDKIDMKVINTLPTFHPKDTFTTLHHFWQKISQFVETFGLTETATKLILQFRLQGEALDIFEMNKERPVREIILSLRDSFGGFPTKTDFEDQMNKFKRGKTETIKSAMNRYEYIITQIYHDQQDLAQIKERKCKDMVKKIAMAEAWEHLVRAEETSNGVDFTYQDRLRILSREEDIIMKRYHPAINSLERCHPLQYDEEITSEEEYEFESEEDETTNEEYHAEEDGRKSINAMTNAANDYPTEEAPLNPDDECLECFNDEIALLEPTFNDLLQENESLKEEMAAMREALQWQMEDQRQGNFCVEDQAPTNPSISLLVDEYDKLKRHRELQEQQPPRFIRVEDHIYERKSTEHDQPEFDPENYFEEDPEDESDYDTDDYWDQPVPKDAVIQTLAAENAQLRREIHLRDILQQTANEN